MIIFKKLKYKNILSVGNAPVEIDFDSAESNLAVGRNGGGKSTILDSLTYALYGKAYRDINKPKLINSINKQKLLVELTFEVGGKNYHIKRGMKPNIFEIYEDKKLIPQDADVGDYQARLEENILKMNYRAYTQIVVLGSATYVPFMHLKPAPRREIIEDLLHLKIFTEMNIQLKEIVSESKTQLQTLDNNISLCEEKIKFIRNNLAKVLKNAQDTIKDKKRQIREYVDKYKQANIEYSELKIQIQEAQEEYDKNREVLEARRSKILDIKNKVSERLRYINKDLVFFNTASVCSTCSQDIRDEHKHQIIETHTKSAQDYTFADEKLNKVLDDLNEKLEELKVLKNGIRDMTANYHEATSTCKHLEQTIRLMKADIDRLHEQHNETEFDVGQVSSIQEELDKYIETREALLSNNAIYKIAAMLLKDSGIKASLIKDYVPIINQYINKYLSEMDFFVQFEIDEQFEETIKSKYRDEFSYNNFSQGEKFRIDLAILLTLRAIAKIRNSCTTNLLILDEIFDSSLDAEGIDAFIKIINMLVEEKQTVFVISHKQDELDGKFDNVYKFSKNGNFTQLEKV